MAHREFLDPQGRRWEVWEVHPRVGTRPVLPELVEGWLAFESSWEKRRLAPIPAGWLDLPADALHKLSQRALFVRERGESGMWPRFPG